ncbi:hypothetical protein MNB_SM-3-1021 [hydrothermal vent metagenome]|uniref:Uncharacterized protein n=1 Tax=hydrothermal vent metagenome TaxID=652676 RepID=A0A1W1D5B7_9ZZZZ
MNFAGLSTDQAPPISVPIRFFLTAPLFGVLAGFFLLFHDKLVFMSRYSIESIVFTHMITIGVFGFVMLGALTQMLPVLAGVKIKSVKTLTTYAHIALTSGLLLMGIGLLSQSQYINTIASFLLGSGFLVMIGAILYATRTIKNITATILGMQISLSFAFVIVLMGLYLLYGYITSDTTLLHYHIANIHSVLAIFGFAGILIIAVSFQVLPMFYVAPRFKRFCKQYVTKIIAFGLILWIILNLFFQDYALVAKMWIALFFWAFATTVWVKLNKRKRPISDVTVWYWRNASIFLTLGSFVWIFGEFFKEQYIIMTAILIGGGFLFSIMSGMLYKIVPFLVWFHLNGMGYMSIPTVNEMIDKRVAKLQFILFVTALVGFIFSFYMDIFFIPSAISFILSMVLLEYNIILPVYTYIQTKKKKPDFDMSMFGNLE